MILLITGKPGIGKSTLIQSVIGSYEEPMRWTVTQEIRDGSGQRVGFRALNDAGQSRVISHKYDIDSGELVGENAVDVTAVSEMFDNAFVIKKKKLLIVDEIGPIQLLSKSFKRSIHLMFKHPSEYFLFASIHQSDEELAMYRTNEHALMITVTEKNRDTLPNDLASVLAVHKIIDELKPNQFKHFRMLVVDYLENQKPVQLEKLLNKALRYVTEKKIRRADTHSFSVQGYHGNHYVKKHRGSYVCDCDLFNGKNVYVGRAGVCSHIQSVSIYCQI